MHRRKSYRRPEMKTPRASVAIAMIASGVASDGMNAASPVAPGGVASSVLSEVLNVIVAKGAQAAISRRVSFHKLRRG
ncbi:MAG: hypothetical protein EAZ65_00940 [Verrucomicrobia bacterium]|nr:MAG: hypothetical protein EAZ84_10450 [Verrucomicrobiota bacterium]TAE89225.1 MAG: hypothetical protein EAZ82_00955 [Verrucomicrobiota bacterium]TAF27899.1 MAG: hypothetical protein EAZ71_00945 [Verrucomicrobiota bacterium]TAF42748.1 MAG: hypothetical protein EAZ65_00940 [Verrucomicrobiota bacterium]